MTLAPEGRKMLRIEQRNAAVPVERKPEWIKAKVQMGPEFVGLKNLVKKEGLHTVCEEAGCPNIFECWEDKEATFLIGGSECTRRCDFCQIDTGKPSPLDRFEPTKVARSVQSMQLRYATVTGVARDDLEDEGVWLYAETVRKIHELNPGTGVELLIPDFSGKPGHIAAICDSKPEVFAHNVETVPRIFKRIRPAFRYERSLDVITQGRNHGMVTKSNLILGMGETREEISDALRDLHQAGCDLITITQYLAPLRTAPARGPLGQTPGIRGPPARSRRNRLPRRHVRPPGPLLLPRRPPLGHRHAQKRPRHPRRTRPHRRRHPGLRHHPPGSRHPPGRVGGRRARRELRRARPPVVGRRRFSCCRAPRGCSPSEVHWGTPSARASRPAPAAPGRDRPPPPPVLRGRQPPAGRPPGL